MYRFTSKTLVDLEKFYERISKNGKILMVYKDYDYAYKYARGVEQAYFNLAVAVMRHESSGAYYGLDKGSVLSFLKNSKNCPDYYFNSKKAESESIAKPVLEKIAAAGIAVEFIDMYCKYKSVYSINNKMKTMLQECTKVVGKNHYGDELVGVHYNVSTQTNLRHNYKNYDIIAQISKENSHTISVEDGYVLVWGDLAQSDFRIAYNLFLRSEENDKVMSQYSDKYEGFARLVSKANNMPFDIDKFKNERKLYKKLTLQVIYGGAQGITAEEQEFINRITMFLKTCDRYQEFKRRLNHRLDLGLGLNLMSYFGHVETCPVYRDDRYSTVTRALNCPMQTGTSEIVMLITNAILDEFYKLGYTEEDVSLYILRHDEPVFKIKESALKDAWVFEQFRTILVDDWIPLEMTVEAGYRYNRPCDELMNIIRKSCEENRDKITVYNIDEENTKISAYYPLPNSITLQFHYNIVEDTLISALFDPSCNQVNYYALPATSKDEIAANLVSKIMESKQSLKNADISSVEIKNNYIDTSIYLNGVFFKFTRQMDSGMNNVVALCDYMTCRYCKKQGVDSPVNPPPQELADFITSRESIEVLNIG